MRIMGLCGTGVTGGLGGEYKVLWFPGREFVVFSLDLKLGFSVTAPYQSTLRKRKQTPNFPQTTHLGSPTYLDLHFNSPPSSDLFQVTSLPSNLNLNAKPTQPLNHQIPLQKRDAPLPSLPPSKTNRRPPRIPPTNKIPPLLLRDRKPKTNSQHTHLRSRLLATLHPPTPPQPLPPSALARRPRLKTLGKLPVLLPQIRRRQVPRPSSRMGDHAHRLLRKK